MMGVVVLVVLLSLLVLLVVLDCSLVAGRSNQP